MNRYEIQIRPHGIFLFHALDERQAESIAADMVARRGAPHGVLELPDGRTVEVLPDRQPEPEPELQLTHEQHRDRMRQRCAELGFSPLGFGLEVTTSSPEPEDPRLERVTKRMARNGARF